MTGEGTTTPNTTDGAVAGVNGSPLAKPVLPVTATVGGIPATVEYYGSASSLIYGVMRILNLAHGNLYALGAFVTAWAIGLALGAGAPNVVLFLLLLVRFIVSR